MSIDDGIERTRGLIDAQRLRPAFLIHKGHRHRRAGEAMSQIAAAEGSRLTLGLITRLARDTSSTATSFFEKAPSAFTVRLADPEAYLSPDSGFPGAQGVAKRIQDERPYFGRMGEEPSTQWVREALAAQEALGVTASLAPTGWIGTKHPRDELGRAMGVIRKSRQGLGSSPMFANLTVDSSWLEDSTLRSILLEEMLECGEKSFYLRVYWPEVRPRYGQLAESSILAGYAEISRVARLEDWDLVLPTSGLTGWIATALGATGFSTGGSWGEQAFSYEPPIRRAKGSKTPAERPRIFDSFVLHTIEWIEFQRVALLEGHPVAHDPFLDEMRERWDREAAHLHYLVAAAGLQGGLAARFPNVEVVKRVRAAREFVTGLARADRLSGQNYPAHLEIWSNLIDRS